MPQKWMRIALQGLFAGLIGYLTVAIVFAAVNLVMGRSPFHTAAVMGAALFYGVKDPAGVAIRPEYVIAFNGVHLLAFMAFGVAASALADLADRGWQLWYVSTFFFIFVAFHLLAAAQALATPMRVMIPDIAVWMAGLAASALMGWYLFRVHPRMHAPQPWSA